MNNVIECKSLADVEKMREETPFLYLASFFIGGRPGSLMVGSKEKIELWKVYGMLCEIQKEPDIKIQIISIVDLNV